MSAAKATSKPLAPIQAVVGSDEAEVKRVAQALAQQLTPPGAGEFACDLIDGAAANADDAASRLRQTINALLTFPFFGGEKLVWLKNVNFLADDVLGRSAAVLEGLEALQQTLAAGLPEGTRFLLSAGSIDKRRSFFKQLAKLADLQTFDRIDSSKSGWQEDAEALVETLAQARQLSLEPGAAELLALRTGGDRRTLLSELEKLSLYAAGNPGDPPRSLREIDVRTLVPTTAETVIFELGNALATRDTRRSLELLEQLLKQEESPIAILLVAIIPTFRNLLAVKDLMHRHKLAKPAQPFFFGKTLEKLPPEAVEHLPRKKDGSLNAFALGLAAQQAHRYSLQELRSAQRLILKTNLGLVSGGDPEGLLRQLVVQITTPSTAA
jgi:DNA polymerase-3 subunit delta